MIDYAPPPSQSQQDDVKIRLKRGEWEIEITCGKDKIKAVIEDVLFGIDISTEANNGLATKVEELRAEIASLKSRVMAIPETHGPGPDNLVRPKVVMSAGATCRGLIELLCHEGYFELEKTLGQVPRGIVETWIQLRQNGRISFPNRPGTRRKSETDRNN